MSDEKVNSDDQGKPFDILEYDVYVYAGEVSRAGYQLISKTANAQSEVRRKKALLVLFTPGGDPHSGFRIARALQCYYDCFDILIPRYCKSAGSLIAIGAKHIYMDDESELGPLDVQLKKNDEIFGHTSGLDIAHAINSVQIKALTAFRNNLVELTRDAGLATKIAADIASNLTNGQFQPIMAQIDPMKLSETQRALEIAYAYGTRLNEKSLNLRENGLGKLINSYPSHGFVIDRKEARTIFIRVDSPPTLMQQLSTALRSGFEQYTHSSAPYVEFYSFGGTTGEQHAEQSSDTPGPDSGDETSRPEEPGSSPNLGEQLFSKISVDSKRKRPKRQSKTD